MEADSQLIKQLLKNLVHHNELPVMDKTNELLRLLNLKPSAAPSLSNAYAKVAICIDLASGILDTSFDREAAMKVSGLKKSQYMNTRRIFQKILGLNEGIGVQEICLQLGLNEVAKKASELFELYKLANMNVNDVDTSHPQYACMAVFKACKLLRKSVSKSKLIECSHLKPMQWNELERQWDKLIAENPNLKPSTDDTVPAESDGNHQPTQTVTSQTPRAPEVESYDAWKHRILSKALLDLAGRKIDHDSELSS